MFVGTSPASTAGHHASAVTLGAGIFASRKNGHHEEREAEFDPERSLGRLVDELGRVMGNDVSRTLLHADNVDFSPRNFQAGPPLLFHPLGRLLPWGPTLLTFLLLLPVPHPSQALLLVKGSLKSVRLPSQGPDIHAELLHAPLRMKRL